MKNPMRISLSAEDFLALITGKTVKKNEFIPGKAFSSTDVEIGLQDIGYSFMLEKILESMQVWPRERRTMFFGANDPGAEPGEEVRIGKILFVQGTKTIRFRIADESFDITPELIHFAKDDAAILAIGSGVFRALQKIIK